MNFIITDVKRIISIVICAIYMSTIFHLCAVLDSGSSSYASVQRTMLNQKMLDAYIDNYLIKNPDIELTKAAIHEMIVRGGAYAYNLFYGDAAQIPTNSPQEYLQAIIDITWYFYSLAINKNEAFDEGTFMINDVHWKLADFLMGYVNLRQDGNEVHSASTVSGSSNPFAYKRESSHLNHSQAMGAEFKHYGIDMRFNAHEWVSPVLPARKRHILFGKVAGKQHRVFFKMENYGLYKSDGLVQHGIEYLQSLKRKALGGDDQAHYRKERVPGQVHDIMLKLKPMLPDFYYDALNTMVKRDGISALYKYVAGWKYLSDQEKPGDVYWRNAIREDVGQLIQEYDNILQRIGREVILTDRDLSSSSRYYQALLHNQYDILPDLAQQYQQDIQHYPKVKLIKSTQ